MDKQMNMAVVGLGFIGLPLALSYAIKGANVWGIDVLPGLVKDINDGKSHLIENYQGKTLPQILSEQLADGRFRATVSYEEAAKQVNTYIVTVGIPVKNGDPDMSYFTSACEKLAGVLKKGDLVIIRSTVIPGSTEEIALPILEKSGWKAGSDFDLAYSSERIAEGKAFEEFVNMPLAVGGVTPASAQRAKETLSFVTEAEIHISDIKVVETAKVIENIQRDVNIAMVQEIARFAEKAGIDTFELIRIANTHRRVNLLVPGPGVGGYCLPNALYYLQPKARELGVPIDLLETARRINDGVPRILAEMVKSALVEKGATPAASKVVVLGLAMKDFSNDDRISPAHQVVAELERLGMEVAAYDPAVPGSYPYKRNTLKECLSGAQALVYLAAQEEFLELDWDEVVKLMDRDPVLFDTRNRVPMRLGETCKLIRI